MNTTSTQDRAHTTTRILSACRSIVLSEGAAAVSTRKVAQGAGVPLSQIHYHFGSRQGLMLAMLKAENDALLERQTAMYARDEPFSQQWRRACDYLDEDVESGYVRVLHEMIAAGYGDDAVRERVREMMDGWAAAITEALRFHYSRGLRLGTLTAEEACALICALFLGAETMILMGQAPSATPITAALRAVEPLIIAAESAPQE